MKNFTKLEDVGDPEPLIQSALSFKKQPYQASHNHKTVGLIFLNPSLRTRLSTQKAALNLGMDVMVMNMNNDGWQLEMQDGTIMDGGSQEHIKDAIRVISEYVDILGIRTFPGLNDRDSDYNEQILSKVLQYAGVPVVSLESAIRHPLQSLADLVTIRETGIARPKVVLSWAPHPKALPQAVANSFLEWTRGMDVTLACPPGYELAEEFTRGIPIVHDQRAAFEGADIIYTKNWSSYQDYGKVLETSDAWMVTAEKMALTNQGKFMHCLPIRRNVVATDEVLDQHSIIYQQAGNRTWAAQAVLNALLS